MNFNKWIKSTQENENKFSYWKSPKKKGSKGEQIVRNFLKKYKIPYKEQFTFKDLYYKNIEFPLRFDFKIWWKDKTFLLEIQGRQHYKPVNFGGHSTKEEVEKQFKENQERDKLKVDYCNKHNLILKTVDWYGNETKLLKDLREIFKEI